VGKLTHYVEPGGPGVRVDSGVEQGFEVPIFYDPQLAKLIVWGPDRETARRRTVRALGEYRISGVKHNIQALREVLEHEAFIRGDLSTHFIAEHGLPAAVAPAGDEASLAAMAAAIYVARQSRAISITNGDSGETRPASNWRTAGRRSLLRESGR